MKEEIKWSNKKSPADTSCFLSKIYFCWMAPLLWRGYKKELNTDDLYVNRNSDSAEELGDRLEKEWKKELSKTDYNTKPSLLKALSRTFGTRVLAFSCLALFGDCVIRTTQAILFGYVVRYFDKGNQIPSCNMGSPNVFGTNNITTEQMYIAAGGLCVASAILVVLEQPFFYVMQECGMRLRIACSTIIYRKILKLSRAATGETTIGQIVNLLSNDVNRFDEVMSFLPYLVIGPLQVVIMGYVLWQYLGPSCLVGVFVLILYLPIQGATGQVFVKIRKKVSVLTDERIRLMNETISAMKVIKMYAWEKAFVDVIAHNRRLEMNKLRTAIVVLGFNYSLAVVIAKLVLLFAFLSYSLLRPDCPLSAETVFVSVTVFFYMRLSLIVFLPQCFFWGAESLVIIQRLQKFLLLEERNTSLIDSYHFNVRPEQCGVWVNNITGNWNLAVSEPTLSNISADVKHGELLAVVGRVGCGKSSLLMSILGELPLSGGTVKVRGKMAYASQEPWVFSEDLRSNILFGQELNEMKYASVLNSCALDKDIKQLPHGDRTLVGEKGVILSGGQKARVNLARAIYLDADIYLLDDPLSAVDAPVAQHLFEKCINGILKDKTRILVTHQLQFIQAATKILVLDGGKCVAYGTYLQLTESGMDLVSLIKSDRKQKTRSSETVQDPKISENQNESTLSLEPDHEFNEDEFKPIENMTNREPATQEEEKRSKGSIDFAMLWRYFKAGGGLIILTTLIIISLFLQIIGSITDFWLSIWTDVSSSRSMNESSLKNDTDPWSISPTGKDMFTIIGRNLGSMEFLYIYAGLTGVLFVSLLIRNTMVFRICATSSVVLHDRMFSSVVRAPMSFFDKNPIGRILNRFTKDMSAIDSTLPITLYQVATMFLGLVGGLAVAVVINYYLAIPVLIFIIVFYFIRKLYLVTSRNLKRIENIVRSPILSHLSNSVLGLTTVRAFSAQEMYERKFCEHQDRHTRCWYTIICGNRLLGIILDWLYFAYLTATTAILVLNSQDKSGAFIGLGISTAVLICSSADFVYKTSTGVESAMTSVERVKEYGELESEAELETPPEKKPPREWPQKGSIVLKDMSLTYTLGDPPVLKKMNCTILPTEKIGIVGRTGAGKSSFIAALLRLCEPDGITYIDGVDTKTIGLHDLRSKISIIPQDPVLFTGSLRRNIDPFNDYKDEDLWTVLKEVQLKNAVTLLPGGLDTLVSEGGRNFSVGQRQLICMARAILRNNRILIMDEATANVDARTDALIQRTVREKFASCTVLTIAHRLNTVMDSDRIMVLDAGEIREFDEAHVLLQDERGFLYDMVKKTGAIMSEKLFEVARKTNELKKEKQSRTLSRNNSAELIKRISITSDKPEINSHHTLSKNLENVNLQQDISYKSVDDEETESKPISGKQLHAVAENIEMNRLGQDKNNLFDCFNQSVDEEENRNLQLEQTATNAYGNLNYDDDENDSFLVPPKEVKKKNDTDKPDQFLEQTRL